MHDSELGRLTVNAAYAARTLTSSRMSLNKPPAAPAAVAGRLFDELTRRSNGLAYRIPTVGNRLAAVCTTEALKKEAEMHALQTRPVMSKRMLPLLRGFLAWKSASGSATERALYGGMGLSGLMDRLMRKRPLAFLMAHDRFLLRDGRTDGAGGFEAVGTADECLPLTLAEVQSYDEIALSALLARPLHPQRMQWHRTSHTGPHRTSRGVAPHQPQSRTAPATGLHRASRRAVPH